MKTTPCLYTLIAAATLAIGGNALAQASPPTSTAGAGCTATGNAMRGGNLSGSPSDKACGGATAAATGTNAPAAAAPMATAPAATAPAASTGMGAPATTAETPAAPARAPVRVAKADRN